MDIGDLKQVFYPKEIALSAIAGCIAGRFCRISPFHGAIYAVVSRIVNVAIFGTGMSIACDLEKEIRDFNLVVTHFIVLVSMASVFLAFAASNKAVSLIAKPLILSTAVKVCLISEVIGLSSRLLMNRVQTGRSIHYI